MSPLLTDSLLVSVSRVLIKLIQKAQWDKRELRRSVTAQLRPVVTVRPHDQQHNTPDLQA